MEVAFAFTDDQLHDLRQWALVLQTEEAKSLRADEDVAVAEASALLADTGFAAGNNLSEAQMEQLFKLARALVGNQKLNRSLIEANGLDNMNIGLRTLLFGEEPLPTRLAVLKTIAGLGHQGATQLLTLKDPVSNPVATAPAFKVLHLTREQRALALQEACDHHGLTPGGGGFPKLLRKILIMRKVREALNLKDYLDVNMVLWFASQTEKMEDIGEDPEGEAADEDVLITSVGLEKDLQAYVAANPHALEPGLTLFDEDHPTEYPTEVGRIDILLKDKAGTPVVVETKRRMGSDRVIGQTMRYMGWLRKEGHKQVRGVIVLHDEDERLTTAMLAAPPSISLKYYAVRFDMADAPIKQ